jgi:hypothetical protein
MNRRVCSIALRSIVGWLLLGSLVSCGPRQEDGGAGGGGAGLAGSGGSVGMAGEAGATTGGSVVGTGGTSGDLGFDSVIGCPASRWPDTATLTILPDTDASFSKVSGNGKVVAGQVGRATMRWTPQSGFETVDGLQYRVSSLNCDGSVLATADTSGGSYRHRLGEEPEQIIPAGDYYRPEPLSMTPDGEMVVGHLIGGVDIGPHPVRWTAATGLERITAMENTLALQVAPDAGSVLGVDTLQIFSFDFGGTKQFVQGWVPSDGQHTSSIVVSADARTYFFNASTDYHSLWIDSVREGINCPSVRCSPIAISGTGKVVVVTGPTRPEVGAPWATFVWTAQHGFRTLNDLLSQYGAPAPGIVFANDVSDDGQVFAGWVDGVGAFYATLPRAAYD